MNNGEELTAVWVKQERMPKKAETGKFLCKLYLLNPGASKISALFCYGNIYLTCLKCLV